MGIDPEGFKEGNIHSFNRYAYGNNNPYRFVDPDGRSPVDGYIDQQWNETQQVVGQLFNDVTATIGKIYLTAASFMIGPELFAGKALVGEAYGVSLGVKLEKALASEAQTAKILAREGEVISGAGTKVPLKQADRLANEVGGKAADWSKVSGGSHVAKDGQKIETHAFENKVTDTITQIKTKLKDEGK